MKKLGVALALFSLFSFDAFSQFSRSTTFDDRAVCQENKGVWREFGNGCVDECYSKFDQFTICTYAITFGCDCGKGRCWNDKSCIAVADYKKVFDAQQEKDKEILAEAKKKRQEAAKANESAIVSDLVKKTETRNAAAAVKGGSNNYSDFYKDDSAVGNIANAVGSAANAGVEALNGSGADKAPPAPAISEAPPIVIDSKTPAPVPPLFLEQEKAKQKSAVTNQATKITTAVPPTQVTVPATQPLPVIALPH